MRACKERAAHARFVARPAGKGRDIHPPGGQAVVFAQRLKTYDGPVGIDRHETGNYGLARDEPLAHFVGRQLIRDRRRAASPNDLVEQRAHAFDVSANGGADGEGFSGGFHRVES